MDGFVVEARRKEKMKVFWKWGTVKRLERGVMPLCRVCTVSMNTNEMENTNLNIGIKGDELKNSHVIKDLRRKLRGEIERVSIETLGWPTACAQWHRAMGNRR